VFFAISLWYENFPQTTDEEVRDLLKRAADEIAIAPVESRSKAA
jgi:putative phosphoribosyl transferase